MKSKEELDDAIIELISCGTEQAKQERFEQLAIDLFSYQFSHNKIYQHYCIKTNKTPEIINHWHEIPTLHTSFFKEAPLYCNSKTIFFQTSGTSTSKRGYHYLDSLNLYEHALKESFYAYCMPDDIQVPFAILFPSFDELPHSSLAYMFHVLCPERSSYYIQNESFQYDQLIKDLRTFSENNRPLMLLGTTLSFMQFFEHLGESTIKLPQHTRLMDTGGTKGRMRNMRREEFYELCEKRLGIQTPYIINEYGMTEMGSQFYDCTFRDLCFHRTRARQKIPPPWVRTQVISTNGIDEVPIGGRGLLRHFDLANRNSVLALQTEDIALRTEAGFEILGRPEGSEPRGCSLTIEDLQQ